MNVRWRAAHDAYEQAAYHDIRAEVVNDTAISDDGLKRFADIADESESVMGVADYADLLNASYRNDAERTRQWKGLLSARSNSSKKHADATTLHEDVRGSDGPAAESPPAALSGPADGEGRRIALGDTVVARENFLYRAGGMLALNAGDTATVLSVDTADGGERGGRGGGGEGGGSGTFETAGMRGSKLPTTATTPTLENPMPPISPSLSLVDVDELGAANKYTQCRHHERSMKSAGQ
jgi:hypothetical protein